MAKHSELHLLEMAADLTKAAFQHPSTDYIVNKPDDVTNFIQAVYDKLKSINDSISD